MSDLILMNAGCAMLSVETVQTIIDLKKAAKVIKEREEKLEAAILAEMKANEVIKIDTPELLINYVEATMRESFDSKAFRKDQPDLYDRYVKLSPVKECLRVKVK